MYITDYFNHIQNTIAQCLAILSSSATYDRRTKFIGVIRGVLTFYDGSELHFREFVDVESGTNRYRYAYHYQREDKLIFRYDNHPHFGHSKTPDHKHFPTEDKAFRISPPDMEKVLKEIMLLLK